MNEAQLREFIKTLILNDTSLRSALVSTMLDDQVQLLDVLNSGDVETMIITTALQLGGIDNVEEHFDTKEDSLSNPATLGRFLTSTVGGVRSWAIPIAQWGDIQGDIQAQNDLILEFQKKEDDLGAPSANGMVLASNTDKTRFWHTLITEWGTITGDIQTQADLLALLAEKEDDLQNPSADGMVLASTVVGERSWKEIIIEWGEIQGTLTDQSDLVAEFAKHFLKTEHVNISAGAQDHGKPVVLNAGGKLDQSMVVAVDFIPMGEFTPTAGTEYPTGTQPFEIWRIGGLSETGYDYLTGTLAGRTALNDNILLFLGADQWALFVFDGDTSAFYLLDGTRALTAPFNAGNQKLSLVADGTANADGVNLGQLNAGLNEKINKSGDIMTGNFVVGTGVDNSGGTITIRGNTAQNTGQQRISFRRPDNNQAGLIYGTETGNNFYLVTNDLEGAEVGRYNFVNGNISISATTPMGENHLTRKDYVDALVALHANLKINKSGDTMTGHLNVGTGVDGQGSIISIRGNDAENAGQPRLSLRNKDNTQIGIIYSAPSNGDMQLITFDSSGTELGRVTIVSGNITVSATTPAGDNSLTRKDYVDALVAQHANLKINPHEVTKAQVGLGSVDNTSDAGKPISTATQGALNSKPTGAWTFDGTTLNITVS